MVPHTVQPPFPRRVRKVGAPIAVLILLGLVTGLIVIGLTAINPVGTTIGFVLSTVAMTIVVLAYLWLDRWEPEPPRLLVLAFLWGASVAVIVSIALSTWLEAVVSPTPEDVESGGWVSVAIIAPVVEEAAKGAFLLIMLTGRRRHEMNSLTDCLVYAGLAAAGFAWLEDILYISGGESVGEVLLTAALRLIMAPFAHPLFTTMTALGVYAAMQRRTPLAKVVLVVLGYAGAVLMHGLWNGSSLLGAGAYFGVYVLWMVPIFGMAIWLAVRGRRREQRVVAEKLPGMVAAGIITSNEASWLGSLRTRKLAVGEVRRSQGKRAAKPVNAFAAQVVELAFVRDRIDRGLGNERVQALLAEEAYAVHVARSAAPALAWLATYRIPG
jgi:protease PrsW